MPLNLKTYIGLKLREFRLQRGLTQAELAEKLDKAVETISNIERGSVAPSLETLEAIAKTLKVPLREFFEAAENERQSKLSRRRLEQELVLAAAGLPDKSLRLAIALTKTLAEHGS